MERGVVKRARYGNHNYCVLCKGYSQRRFRVDRGHYVCQKCCKRYRGNEFDAFTELKRTEIATLLELEHDFDGFIPTHVDEWMAYLRQQKKAHRARALKEFAKQVRIAKSLGLDENRARRLASYFWPDSLEGKSVMDILAYICDETMSEEEKDVLVQMFYE